MRRGPGRPPFANPGKRRRRVNLMLAPETDDGLDVLAAARGTTRSGVVDELVAEALRGLARVPPVSRAPLKKERSG